MAEEAGTSAGEWVPVTGKKADVWRHFLHHTVILGRKCKHCGKFFSEKTSTSTLSSHIKETCQVLKSQTLPSTSLSVPGSEKTGTTTLNSHIITSCQQVLKKPNATFEID